MHLGIAIRGSGFRVYKPIVQRNIAIRKGLGYISSLWVMGVCSPKRGVTILSLRKVIQNFPIDNTHKWVGVRVNMSRSGFIGWMETTRYERLSIMREVKEDCRAWPFKLLPRCATRSGGRLFPWLSFSLASSCEGPPPLTFLFILPPSLFGASSNPTTLSLYRRTLGDLMRRGGVVSLFCSGLGSISRSSSYSSLNYPSSVRRHSLRICLRRSLKIDSRIS
ncbi:hypothetical protein Tco_0846419 [Tanacetum coccineum]